MKPINAIAIQRDQAALARKARRAPKEPTYLGESLGDLVDDLAQLLGKLESGTSDIRDKATGEKAGERIVAHHDGKTEVQIRTEKVGVCLRLRKESDDNDMFRMEAIAYITNGNIFLVYVAARWSTPINGLRGDWGKERIRRLIKIITTGEIEIQKVFKGSNQPVIAIEENVHASLETINVLVAAFGRRG